MFVSNSALHAPQALLKKAAGRQRGNKIAKIKAMKR